MLFRTAFLIYRTRYSDLMYTTRVALQQLPKVLPEQTNHSTYMNTPYDIFVVQALDEHWLTMLILFDPNPARWLQCTPLLHNRTNNKYV